MLFANTQCDDYVSVALAQRLGERVATDKGDIQK
jgi:hypothetical protein